MNNLNNRENNKIAILADIHSNYFLLTEVLKDIKRKKISELIFLGDYITDGFENNEVINIIKKYKNVIAGNRDLSIANYDGISWNNSEQFKNMLYTYNNITSENMSYLKTLPYYKIITLNNKKICLSHGTPYDTKSIVNHDDFDVFDNLIKDYNCDIYLFAHTHEAYCTRYKHRLFINPGSIVLPADGPGSKYGILDLESMNYEQCIITYESTKIKNYYLNSDYFSKNKEWCNILIYTNEMGIDYMCAFIDYIKKKALKENVNIEKNIPNVFWNTAFLEFMKLNNFDIY